MDKMGRKAPQASRRANAVRQKQRKSCSTADPVSVPTTGKIFANGNAIEPVQDEANPEQLSLLCWNGARAISGSEMICDGQSYVPAPIDPTILKALTLPTGVASYGSPRKLLAELGSIMTAYGCFPENSITAMSRWALSTWFPEVQPAPGLSLVGPDTSAGRQQFQLLHLLCRHGLMLTEVSVAGLLTLPMGWQLTLLIQQPELSFEIQRILSSARRGIGSIPRGGRVLEFHCGVATYTELGGVHGSGLIPSFEISVPHSCQGLPVIDNAMRQKIADDFQPKLLRYRLENFSKVVNSVFDAPTLVPSIRELAKNLGACTPDDPDLQAQVPEFLRIQNKELRSAAWLELRTVIIEAILAYLHEAKQDCIYVREIANAAEAILAGRGESRKVEPREVGPRLHSLGLITEERNSKGIRLVLTSDVSRRVHQLARDFSVPSIQNGARRCPLCGNAPPKVRV
jgi:hypothetical protein